MSPQLQRLPLTPRGRRPVQPTLIIPGAPAPVTFDSLEALAAHVHRLAAGRPLILARTFATYPGFDTFEAVSIRTAGVRPEHVCAAAIPGRSAEDLERRLAAIGGNPSEEAR